METGSYDTHKECMAKLVKLIDDNIRLKAAVKINKIDVYNEIDFVDSYHERQQSLTNAYIVVMKSMNFRGFNR